MTENRKAPHQEEKKETLIRILNYDLPGEKNLYSALTQIKGVSWVISNAVCINIGIDRNTKLGEIKQEYLKKIEVLLKKLEVYDYLKNRRSDLESGETKHLLGTDLDLAKEFDIKRMKKIKSYKGARHTLGQPVRGQRTRSHFRKVGIAVGVSKKKAKE